MKKIEIYDTTLRDGAQSEDVSFSVEDLENAVLGNDVDYLIEDAFSWTGTTSLYLQPALDGWRQAEPQALNAVFETVAPVTRVWRIEKTN